MRITENDIRRMVTETVRRIKQINESAYKYRSFYPYEALGEMGIDEDTEELYVEQMENAGIEDEYSVKMTANIWSDPGDYWTPPSGGIDDADVASDDGFAQNIEKLQNQELKEFLKSKFEEFVDNELNDGDWEDDGWDDGPDPDDYYEERRERDW